MNRSKHGILLLNLGTPDHCDQKSVRAYLHEFLSDPRVVDIHAFLRLLTINLLIIPRRLKKTTAAYQKIWSAQGSPLLFNTKSLSDALTQELGDDYQVEFAMRYGKPTIPSAWNKLKNVEWLTVIPLFPQYSSAATGSALQKLLESFNNEWNMPALHIKHDFYHDPGFIHAYANLIQHHLKDKKIDMLIFSYHGLPVRHIQKSNCAADCDQKHLCPTIDKRNYFCYRAKCFATARLIAEALNIPQDRYAVSFQSRLGRTPWIKPYTDQLLPQLIQRNVKDIAIVSPSFVADCLETLEEINIRTRMLWQTLGGNEFIFIPSLNDSPIWVKALAKMVKTIS